LLTSIFGGGGKTIVTFLAFFLVFFCSGRTFGAKTTCFGSGFDFFAESFFFSTTFFIIAFFTSCF